MPLGWIGVRLSKLKLAGFKTFVDPATVLTPSDLVGVVGPNGCGKSNIVDAVRWVLGESRASALRGTSMQDVIFNGSGARKAVSRASVELVFDNREGRAGGAWARYGEISVRRVLERDGESTYLINNAVVRRRDVVDLFLGTGLGPRAYAIIEQGMISRIVEARPQEVRVFLEEAAGVSKYRERRRETQGRLDDAAANLERLNDIRQELALRVERLQAQAAAALRYRQAQEALRQQQQLLWLLRQTQAHERALALDARCVASSQALQGHERALEQLRGQTEALRARQLQAGEQTQTVQSALYAARAEVARIEGERDLAAQNRQRIEARLEQITRERTQWQQKAEQGRAEQTRLQAVQAQAQAQVEQARAQHEALASAVPQAEAAVRAQRQQYDGVRHEGAEARETLRVAQARQASHERTRSAVQERQRQNAAAQQNCPPPLSAEQIAASQTHLQQQQSAAQTLAAEHADLRTQLAALERDGHEAHSQWQALSDPFNRVRARCEALEQLQARIGGQGKLGEWLRQNGWQHWQALWQGIRVAVGWERAVEAVLQERLAALVAQSPQAALDMLRQTPPESFALVLDWPQALPAAAAAPVLDGRPLSPLLAQLEFVEPRYQALCAHWLDGFYALERLEGWLKAGVALAPQQHLVTPQGYVLSAGVLRYLAAGSRAHGALERQTEIAALNAEQAQLAAQLEQAETRRTALNERLQNSREQQQRTREAMQQAQAAAHRAELEHLQHTQTRQRALDQAQRLEDEAAQLAQQLASEETALDELQAVLARAQADWQALEQALQAQMPQVEAAESALQASRTDEKQAASALAEAHLQLAHARGKLDNIAQQLAQAGEREQVLAHEHAQQTAEHEAHCEHSAPQAARLEAALGTVSQQESALASAREQQEAASTALRQHEEQRLLLEREIAPLREQLGDFRLQAQAARLEAEQFDQRLQEAGAEREALSALLDQHADDKVLQREVSRLERSISQMGAVNLAAVEDLAEAGERKQYLDVQHADLTEAITTLETAIKRLDGETRAQLKTTYDRVSGYFGEYFPQLFGGGRAALELGGDEILDAGIQIVAQPPGKKNTSLHLLSGGEKALTAIALVFALFRLNPAPFCLLDEVDAPLDDANTRRYCALVQKMAEHTQFVFITHSKITMEIAQRLVGVTMHEEGVSRIVDVDIDEALRLAGEAA